MTEERFEGEEELVEVLVLSDDEGNEVEYECLTSIEYEGKNYVVLLSFDEEEDQVLILEETPVEDSEDAEYSSVDDDDILEAVFDIFKEEFADEFNFE